MNRPRSSVVGTLALTACLLPATAARLELAPPFTDHAVLQCDRPVPVWGRATPGDRITVAHRGREAGAVTDATGRWRATLAPLPATATGADLVVHSEVSGAVTLRDVVVGEVWLAAGQSNMEWPLQLTRDAATTIAAAHHPLIRHLQIGRSPADAPADHVPTSGWKIATPDTAGSFTAVGYFFARDLSARLGIPVGLIHSSWGGTPIESWLAESVLRTTTAWPRFDADWQEALRVFPQKLADHPALEAAWRRADEEQRATGTPNPLPWPHPPIGPGTAYAPGALCHGMILPLAPYALRGALWYQGESNVGRAAEYAELFPALIRSWRATWAQGDFPFLFVQLPNFADKLPSGRQWAALREAQAAALALPEVGMAVAIDNDEPDNIHPVDKRPVGSRLARLAADRVYHLPVESAGPTYRSFTRTGAALRLRFTHAAGLTLHAGAATGFELAGADRVFHPATATVDGDEVVVSATAVPDPVAVRYAWTNAPASSLANAAGLPAAPFRTDHWPVTD